MNEVKRFVTCAAVLALWPVLSCAEGEPGQIDSSVVTWTTEIGQLRRISSKAEWNRRRQEIVDNVQLVMGNLPRPEYPVELDPKVVSTTVDGNILRKKVSYHTDDASKRVTAWLLAPNKPASSARPAILCLHQTTRVGKDEPAGLSGDPELAYARELAEKGFVTLAPDYPTFGEYKYDFQKDTYASGSMKAIYDNIRAVDFLSSLEEVDASRIGAIGHSLGGHNAIFTAFFEPRIRVVVSNCGFTSFHRYYGGDLNGWTSDRYMPRIRDQYHSDPSKMPFDFTELVAGLAPRPFLSIAPLHDHNFEVQGVKEVIAAALPVYRLYSAEQNLRAIYPDCRHEFPTAVRNQAYDFLAEHMMRNK